MGTLAGHTVHCGTLYMYVLCEYIHGKVYRAYPHQYRLELPLSVITECTSLGYYVLKYLVATATLFDFLFHRFVMRRIYFTYINFALGLHGDVDVGWSGGLLVLELH
jgi:hypothetical protein